ncbi:MAG: hypothetical protein SGJ24_03835 [Chloroflexota bacterium]|nr:hypothetical protein [Chloroflexota bacterium]
MSNVTPPRAIRPIRTIFFIALALIFGLGMAFFFTRQYDSRPAPALDPGAGAADDPRQIIYMSNADGDWDLYQLTLGTRATVNLTSTDADEGFPSYSADGEAVSYVSNADRATENELTAYNMNADGTGQARVVNDLPTILNVIGNGWFDWDIIHIGINSEGVGGARVLVTLRDFNLEVYAGRQDEDGAWVDRNITRSGAIDWFPAISADMTQVLYSSDRDGNQEMVLLTLGADAESDVVRRLTDDPADDISAAFTNDGNALFYSERDGTLLDGGAVVLYTLDLSDPAAQPVLVESIGLTERADVQFAPAGDRIIFMGHDGNDWEIYSEDAGARVVNLTDNDADDLFPAWR